MSDSTFEGRDIARLAECYASERMTDRGVLARYVLAVSRGASVCSCPEAGLNPLCRVHGMTAGRINQSGTAA